MTESPTDAGPATGDGTPPAERVEHAYENADAVTQEAAEEIAEAVEDAADEVEDAVENADEQIADAIDDAAETVAAQTGLDEESVRALIREELENRFPSSTPASENSTVVSTTTTTVESPVDDEPVEVDVAPSMHGGSFAARFLSPRRKD